MKILLDNKEFDINKYKESKIKENDEELTVFSFEYDAYNITDRDKIRDLLHLKPIDLSIESKETIQVMVNNWSENYQEERLPYHFRVELTPYKKTYALQDIVQDFMINPILALIKLNEGLIMTLVNKEILSKDEIINTTNRLFADEKTRDEILEFYYGSDVAEKLKSAEK